MSWHSVPFNLLNQTRQIFHRFYKHGISFVTRIIQDYASFKIILLDNKGQLQTLGQYFKVSSVKSCILHTNVVIVIALGFTTLLTSQVISVAFYSEREKSGKSCSRALISAWGSFMCRKSKTRDPWFLFPSEGSYTQDFYALKNQSTPAGFEPAHLGSSGEYDNHGTTKPMLLQSMRNNLRQNFEEKQKIYLPSFSHSCYYGLATLVLPPPPCLWKGQWRLVPLCSVPNVILSPPIHIFWPTLTHTSLWLIATNPNFLKSLPLSSKRAEQVAVSSYSS